MIVNDTVLFQKAASAVKLPPNKRWRFQKMVQHLSGIDGGISRYSTKGASQFILSGEVTFADDVDWEDTVKSGEHIANLSRLLARRAVADLQRSGFLPVGIWWQLAILLRPLVVRFFVELFMAFFKAESEENSG